MDSPERNNHIDRERSMIDSLAVIFAPAVTLSSRALKFSESGMGRFDHRLEQSVERSEDAGHQSFQRIGIDFRLPAEWAIYVDDPSQ